MGKTRHIAFCVDDKYARYVAVTIKSIAENFNDNGDKICIHVLTDYISGEMSHRLHEVTNDYGWMSLHIYDVDDSQLQALRTNGWGIYTWYRLLLPSILPQDIDKVLYLDADTIVVDDLRELFDIDMTDRALAAVVEDNTFERKHYDRLGYDSSKHYVCAGVMMINLTYWREHHLNEEMIEWATNHRDNINLLDQDTINYLCQDNKILLPLRYGIVQFFFTNDSFYELPILYQLEECIERPAIIHYAYCAPWQCEAVRHIMHKEWIKYNKMLRHPVRRGYKAKSWLKVKIFLWDMLHFFRNRAHLTIEDVRAKIIDKKQQLY